MEFSAHTGLGGVRAIRAEWGAQVIILIILIILIAGVNLLKNSHDSLTLW
jgi:hypothetical protein